MIDAPISKMALGIGRQQVASEELVGTKSMTNGEEINLMLQTLEFRQEQGNIASLTAIVGRLPLFTVCKHEGLMCLRLKEFVVFGQSAAGPVYIVPSDE
jgi:hypothetical protein